MTPENDGKTPSAIAPLPGAINSSVPDPLEYYAYDAADRLKFVKEKIEDREKAYFNLYLIQISLDGNPEPGTHIERDEEIVNQPPCLCRDCELPRVNKLLEQMTYAINQLKAVHAGLA